MSSLANQLGLKRCWNLATSSATVEFHLCTKICALEVLHSKALVGYYIQLFLCWIFVLVFFWWIELSSVLYRFHRCPCREGSSQGVLHGDGGQKLVESVRVHAVARTGRLSTIACICRPGNLPTHVFQWPWPADEGRWYVRVWPSRLCHAISKVYNLQKISEDYFSRVYLPSYVNIFFISL